MRYFIELSYNGKAYHGWQIQPNAITVQEVLNKGLSLLLRTTITTMGAGRTDAGVHALQMFAHFEIHMSFETETLQHKLNSYLPQDIVIHSIFKVNAEAHTRFDALSRAYIYRIAIRKNAFINEQTYFLKPQLDIEKLKKASKILLEYKDFQCFSKSNTDVKTYHCDIMQAEWQIIGDELQFTIKANRFLRNMVRAIVGSLINIGVGKLEVSDMHKIIQSKSRSEAGFSVPARALYLSEIIYPESIYLNE
ncbi:tRNA pseudouridine(38-40) synthase TruA [Bizionia gelidisalsuginis]|uniref:tRNA pseudouridine synthase A n=2 Tax=Bizionia TaxID=283785 RepID=A0A8H2LH39_9FLAO|nr:MULTISPECIES: tRNA pseudouridine(38-40) synthase TruA [Bizionia]TYB80392.1 tRNA pseudouridine(38-40) synthase TruA [Bizionia saleffrena]TYC09686.1 tRNA pseudouridine(38-40) synthase TruA [Bizionia gelidisalsuginis]